MHESVMILHDLHWHRHDVVQIRDEGYDASIHGQLVSNEGVLERLYEYTYLVIHCK